MKKAITLCFFLLGLLFVQNISAQTAGIYDPSFANAGELSDPVLNPFKYSSMALVPGNEFVISRISHDTLIVVRFLVNGGRDVTFGPTSNGVSYITLPWSTAAVLSSAVQSDRKTLIGGRTLTSSSSSKGFLVRLNDDGSVDHSFGTNGFVYQNLYPSTGDGLTQVTVQPDGKILVLDQALNTDSTDTLALLRYTVNGDPDNSFNLNGVYNVPFYRFLPSGPFFFKVDLSNNITFAAYSNFSDTDNLYLFQLNPAGASTGAYGQAVQPVDGGNLITSPSLINRGFSLGLNFQADDKLILTQSSLVDSIQWIVSRFNTDGTPDVGFGDSGVVNMQGGDGGVPYDIHSIQPTPFSQIVVAGLISLAGSTRIDVTRLNNNGSIDGAFGLYQGHAILNCVELDDYVANLIIQPDERILINGLVAEKGYVLNQVIRLLGSGTGGNTAIDEVATPAMSIYPNPAGNAMFVSIPGAAKGSIEMADVQGRIVIKQELEGNVAQQFSLENLPGGLYVVTFRNGDEVLTGKIVKQ